jgi:flagellar biosynthesis GTPase FlhF
MAGICFSAHETRRYELSFDKYEKDVADDLRENLVIMFKHAQSKGFFKNSTAARQIIPRLASIRLRDNKEKVQLVQELIKHYDSARSDMAEIEGLMASGSQIDADFIDTAREHVIALYHNLRQGGKWRNVLPYTPLPKKSLLKLRNLIKCNGKFFLLGDLIHHIDEIEGWLSLPPPPRDYFTGVMEEYMRANAVPTKPSVGLQHQPTPEEVAKQQEAARIKEQREKAHREAAQLKLAAQQRAQEAVKRKKETDDAREREKQVQEENAHQAKKIRELEAQKAKDAAEIARLRQAEVAKRQEQAQQEDPIAKERAELEKKSELFRQALEELSDLESNGQITPAALKNLDAPSKQNCLVRLRDLWENLQHDVATVEPRELLQTADSLLRFDFNLLDAHCLMKVLTCRGCAHLKPHSTGWDFAAMVKLQNRLLPYAVAANRTLFGVVSSVNGICTILMEGLQRERAREQLEASKRMNTSTGSSTGTTMTGQGSISTPQSSLGTSFGSSAGSSNNNGPGNPFQKASNTFPPQGPMLSEPLDTTMTDSGSSDLPSQGQNGNLFGSRSSNNSASRPQQGSSGQFVEACRAYKKGECRKGINCKYPHNPCKHWMRDQCTFGDKCKRSHDPFCKENNKGEPMVLDPVHTPHQSFVQASPFGGSSPAIPTGPKNARNQPFTRATSFGIGSSAIPAGSKIPLVARMMKNPVLLNVLNQPFGSQNTSNSNVFGRAPASAPTGPRAPLTDRMLIDSQPSLPPQTQNFGFQGASASASQAPPQTKQNSSKKDACKSFLKGRCNKSDEECRYAHKACPFFLQGKCKFGDKCNKGSHDEAFRNQGTPNGNAQQPPKPFQGPTLFPQGPMLGEQQPQQQPGLNADTAEKYLSDIMKTKPGKAQPNNNSIATRHDPRTEQPFHIGGWQQRLQEQPSHNADTVDAIIERWKQRPQEQPSINADTVDAIMKAERAKLQARMNRTHAPQTQQPFQAPPKVPTSSVFAQQPSLNASTAENYLDAIVKAAPKPKPRHHNNNNTLPAAKPAAKKPNSEIPCLFQKKNPIGCTNRACPFLHNPPKTTADSRGGHL